METFLILILILIAVSIVLTIFFYNRKKYEKKQFILFLLNLLENSNSWEEYGCPGLCNLLSHIYCYDRIDLNTYKKYNKILKSMNPNYLNFWFEQYQKQPRIDYLKKELEKIK